LGVLVARGGEVEDKWRAFLLIGVGCGSNAEGKWRVSGENKYRNLLAVLSLS